eukprot:1286234-Karenia_brevis.AAC.1
MPPTHVPGSRVLWGQPKCTSWKWDGRCNGGMGKYDLRTTWEMFGSPIHCMAWAYSGKCWTRSKSATPVDQGC